MRDAAAASRRWAQALDNHSADPRVFISGRLHQRTLMPDGGVLDQYCAAGLAVPALEPDKAHHELWEAAAPRAGGVTDFALLGSGEEHTLDPEIVDAYALWPLGNPWDLAHIADDPTSPMPAEEAAYSGPEKIYAPLDAMEPDNADRLRWQHPGAIGQHQGQEYISITALSDAGQRYWPEIAAFLRRHADRLESEIQAGNVASTG